MYNVEKYIEDCLCSIVAAKDVQYEIICVDDCSQDGSFQKAKDFKDKHPEIKMVVIKNEINKGVSYTRNVAFGYSTGEYIWFVDPDDMINASSVAPLFVAAKKENADFAFGNYAVVEENEHSIHRDFSQKYLVITNSYDDKNFPEILPHCENKVMQSVCCGIYKKSFLQEHNISFPDEISFCEDLVFNYKVFAYFNQMVKYNDTVYFYRMRDNSTSHTKRTSIERQKKYYCSTRRMINIYQNYLEEGIYNTSESRRASDIVSLKIKIQQVKQSTLNWLATVNDAGYVRQQLKELKREKIYPYPFIKSTLQDKGLKRFLLYLIPIEPFFWLLFLLYKLHNRK